MAESKRSKIECESAIADIYSVGYTTLGIARQLASIVGTLAALATIWSISQGDLERSGYAAVLAVACFVTWRWSDKKLDAVGPDGETYWTVKDGF